MDLTATLGVCLWHQAICGDFSTVLVRWAPIWRNELYVLYTTYGVRLRNEDPFDEARGPSKRVQLLEDDPSSDIGRPRREALGADVNEPRIPFFLAP